MELPPSLLFSLKTQDPGTLDKEYSVVRSKTLALKRDLSLTTQAGALKENIKKNRYKDILPYDQTRVPLSLVTSESDSDYINANFIKGALAHNRYIASQGPLGSTVTDFWRMIWQYDVKVIVMACREVEMGKKKCECYWAALHQSAAFGPFTVHNQEETSPNEDIVVRTLSVTFQQETRSLVQYQFLSWPDHDIPHEATGVLDLLDKARAIQGTHTSPMLIHCSAGCGRTGVICALDYIHDLLVTKQITSDFSIMKIVQELRSQRPSAVQTKEQYQFIFKAAACMFERGLKSSENELYCNLSELKKPEKKTSISASSSKRLSKLTDMNDTYAVVNKPKHPHPPPTGSSYSVAATPRQTRSLPPGHQYDNESAGASAAPVYSIVKPRVKPNSVKVSSTTIYDNPIPSNHSPGEGALSSGNKLDYHLVSAHHVLSADDDYEYVTSTVTDKTNLSSPAGIGFNCRIQKPRGPRDPPAEWSRLER